MAKFGFTGPVATGLSLGKRESNRAIFTSLTFWSLHTELKEKFFFLQVYLPEFKAIALA